MLSLWVTYICQQSKRYTPPIPQVRLLKWLKHPCVLTLFDVFLSADGRLVCLTTTYCESGDLAKIVKHAAKTKSLLGEKTVLGWFAQVRRDLTLACTGGSNLSRRDHQTHELPFGRLTYTSAPNIPACGQPMV